MITKVNHVGVVVKDMQEELEKYDKIFGLKPAVLKDAMDGRLRVAFIRPPDGEIELLQPIDMSTSFGKFLQTHGPGLHHYALETDDIDAEVERMKKAGVAFDTEKARIGAHGVKIIFTRPETTMGLYIELCEAPSK